MSLIESVECTKAFRVSRDPWCIVALAECGEVIDRALSVLGVLCMM